MTVLHVSTSLEYLKCSPVSMRDTSSGTHKKSRGELAEFPPRQIPLRATFSMGSLEETCASLRAQITATEEQLAGLRRDLANAEQARSESATTTTAGNEHNDRNGQARRWPLLQEEYKRYGRQMIVSQVGLKGERQLLDGR
jgi:hypothetical protein